MMRHEDFCAMILTHGRSKNVKTLRTLKACGYTGKIVLVLDMDEPDLEGYKKLGEHIEIFDKSKVECDVMDNFGNKKCILFARNAAFDIAEKVGARYFCELDDDYTEICKRFSKEAEYKSSKCEDLDEVFDSMIDFIDSDERILSVSMMQSGDFMGGSRGHMARSVRSKRKVMNAWVLDTKKRFAFRGFFNDDINTYTFLGSCGWVFLSTNVISLTQIGSQKGASGMTESYKKFGTYVKSFYSVMMMPSCVKISVLGEKYDRIHNKVKWNNCVPKILRK